MSIILAVVALGVLVTVHELGHFIAAKLSGVYVETFSIGFGPKLFSFHKGDTEYRLSLIPLGGYVKLYKMFCDEEDPEPADDLDASGRELFYKRLDRMKKMAFFDRPVYKKLFIITAGVLFNIIFAVVLFAAINAVGVQTYSAVVGKIIPGGTGDKSGFEPGDKILSVDGEVVDSWDSFAVYVDGNKERALSVLVDRHSRELTLTLQPAIKETTDYFGEKITLGMTDMYPMIPALIGSVQKGSPADKAGIMIHDIIVSINGVSLDNWYDIGGLVQDGKDGVDVTISRDGGYETFHIIPSVVGEEGKERYVLGISPPKGDIVVREPVFKAVGNSFQQTFLATKVIYKSIWQMVKGKASRNDIGGPVMIVQATSESVKSGYEGYLALVALISINLAILNILPLPVLDGGYVVMFIYEGITGKRVSKKVREASQRIGFTLLMMLMLFAVYNDILRIIKR